MTASLHENGYAEFKYSVWFQTGSSNMAEAAHAQWKIDMRKAASDGNNFYVI